MSTWTQSTKHCSCTYLSISNTRCIRELGELVKNAFMHILLTVGVRKNVDKLLLKTLCRVLNERRSRCKRRCDISYVLCWADCSYWACYCSRGADDAPNLSLVRDHEWSQRTRLLMETVWQWKWYIFLFKFTCHFFFPADHEWLEPSMLFMEINVIQLKILYVVFVAT